MNYATYLERSARRKVAHESERMGQAYFNQLAEDYPEIASRIRGTEVDPFYDDKRISAFLATLVEYYEAW
jgi:hypothetical protein